MRVVAVLDIMGDQVVHGRGGRRDQYRPIASTLTPSTEPAAVAQALHEHLGLQEFYIADLDAIAGATPSWGLYRQLQSHGYRLWIDAGVRQIEQAIALAEAGIDRPVLGLETLASPEVLHGACAALGGNRVVFSLDLCDGKPVGQMAAWGTNDLARLVAGAVGQGLQSVLVLDLRRVGMDAGTGTEALCRRLAQAHPNLEIAAGGGIRGMADLRRLAEHGASAVLVASALHDGRLGRDELAAL